MSDDTTRRQQAYEKGNAKIDAAVNAYLDKAIDWSVTSPEGRMYAEDSDPANRQRDALYLLIQKERMYIDALRRLTAEWVGKSASLMPPAVLDAMAWIQAYEQVVESKLQPADSEANDGQ